MIGSLVKFAKKLSVHQFLFEELVKRDFKKKYKRTVLGMGWSMLMPLLTLAVLYVVFSQMFGRKMEHFSVYLFCGNVVYSWFSDATKQGMRSLVGNAGIFTKVNVPKYLFLCAKNVQTVINFGLTLIVFFAFCAFDGVEFSWKFVLLAYPVLTLLLFNLGVGLVVSALYVFFRDMDYLWGVFTQLLMYGSAIFYPVDRLPHQMQEWLAWNPVYRHIDYFREVVLRGTVPSLSVHMILLGWALAVLVVGAFMYKRYNTRFLYYV